MPTARENRGMSHPDVVQSALGDESVAARVDLGDDALFVTPTRTLVYRADSLLSDESISEFPHGAERISVSAGRRKATITLDYGLDGERSFTVPSKRLDSALHPVLAGTLNATGVTDPGETVTETFRFSELTLVVTSDRLVKHIGNAVWDEEFEEYHYDDVTDLAFEEGNVATAVVVTHGGRQERFKAPNERAREIRERLTQAVLAHHGVDSLPALRERFAADADEPQSPSATMSFGEGPTPLSANPGELTETPKNATRGDEPAETESVASADAPTASEATPDADVAASTHESEGGNPGAATTTHDDAETAPQSVSAEAPSGETGAGASTVDRVDVDTADTLLGGAPETGATAAGDVDESTDDASDEGDVDLAALAAEVEALRESVDAQNERIAHQEELIERLIGELRTRL
jgi:hypothetical protein